MPTPPDNIKLFTYADDMTTLTSHQDHITAQSTLQPYLNQIHDWRVKNNLKLNADKSTSTLFSNDNKEFNTQLNLSIGGSTIPTFKNSKVLGLYLDPSLTFNHHISETK